MRLISSVEHCYGSHLDTSILLQPPQPKLPSDIIPYVRTSKDWQSSYLSTHCSHWRTYLPSPGKRWYPNVQYPKSISLTVVSERVSECKWLSKGLVIIEVYKHIHIVHDVLTYTHTQRQGPREQVIINHNGFTLHTTLTTHASSNTHQVHSLSDCLELYRVWGRASGLDKTYSPSAYPT